ncbi:cytochrome b561 domain-containing protein [uncultured Jannaschia sp.]|uniref:cytochrome b561 domain-containing protein n=1 Tax=uncultured Jannaschia sp. TaxID=293347 RepID=UPI00260A4C64|nr:cytochrome b561 domain-containing protein [uncultured Jannaschia sp.]
MIDWLFTPIDASRAHDLSVAVKYHARVMVIAWGILVPLGVIAARFFKVLPRQRYPEVVDNRAWWRAHLTAQIGALILTLVGMWLILTRPEVTSSLTATSWLHRSLGWAVLWLGIMQGASGAFRGSRGGPDDPRGSMRGDHYDMTPRRLAFEAMHKVSGYAALILSMGAVLTGLWQTNAPHWMWIVLPLWWGLMGTLFWLFQKRGMVIDTYAAIWGPDAIHPGNARRRPPEAGE